MELDEWKNASKKRIEKMTFDEARKILKNQIRLGKEGGKWCPREHTTHAYEMILKRAVAYEKLRSMYENLIEE